MQEAGGLWTKDYGSQYGGLGVWMDNHIKIDSLGGLWGPKAFLAPPPRQESLVQGRRQG